MRLQPWALSVTLLLLAGCKPTAVWSPDGKQLALDPRGQLFTYDLAAKRFRQHTRGPRKTVSPVWSPDGARIAYHAMTVTNGLASSTDLMALDVATGQHSVLIPRLQTVSAKVGEQAIGSPPELVREMLHTAWSPDGKQLAYTAVVEEEPSIWVAEADGKNPRALLKERHGAYHLAWSPDSTRIAFYSSVTPPMGQSQGTVSMEVVSADGSDRKVLWDGASRGSLAGFGPLPRWSADGKSLWVTTEMDRREKDPFGRKAGLWRVPADGAGSPVEGPQLDAPPAFLTTSAGGAAFFYAPKDAKEQDPRVGFAGPELAGPRTLGTLNPAAVGLTRAQSQEVDGFPVPNISPDGSRIAVAFVPKTGPASLLLYSTTPGAKPERVVIPFPAAPKKPPAKKPAPQKPVRKRR